MTIIRENLAIHRTMRHCLIAALVIAVVCGVNPGDAQAASWQRVGTVTTLTNNQLCYTDGSHVVCDSTAPTNSGGLIGIGSTAPVVSLDLSQVHDAIALPIGTNGNRPTAGALASGEIRYNTATPAVEYYNGSNWISLQTSGGAGTVNSGTQYQIGYYPSTGSTISGDASITTDANNDFIIGSGNLAIGTTALTSAITITGQAAETIGMIRELTASAAGNNLTLQAGGAVSAGTNLSGGNLILASGISTGTGSSNILFTTYNAGSTGTTDNPPFTALTLSATGSTGVNPVTTLQATPGSGTNQNGGTLNLASGVSTGTGTSAINFNVYKAGSSGSTANNATTAMTIGTNGNVGIGTASPGQTLDVRGINATSAQFVNSDSTRSMIRFASNNGGAYTYIGAASSAGDFGIWNSAATTQLLDVTQAGLVGIGSTSPVALLNIGTATSASSWTTTGINFATNAVTYTDTSGSGTIATRAINSFGIPTLASSSTETVTNAATVYIGSAPIASGSTTITNPLALEVAAGTSYFGGNVGIGTSGPTHAVDVYGNGVGSSNTPLSVTNTANGNYNPVFVGMTPNLGSGNAAIIQLGAANSANNAASLNFIYNGSGSTSNRLGAYFYGSNELFSILASGNVGIGSTSPVVSLDVGQKHDAVALPVGTNGTRPTSTALASGEIRYNSATPAVEYYNGSNWISLQTSGGAGTVSTGTQYQMAYYSASGSTVSGDASITTDATNDFLITSGNLAIGTTAITDAITLTGQAAETIGMVRELTASTVGNNLILQAGGAVLAGTNLSGGNLILASGVSTGTGTSNIQFETYTEGSTGTTDNPVLTALTLSASGVSGTNAATTLQANAGSGTNQNGGTLNLASGVSTGTGASSINFNVYGAGSSGSAANSATTEMTVSSSGVGIGTTSLPTGVTAGVNGAVQVAGTGSESCNANTIGAVRLNPSNGHMEICTYP